MQTLHLLILCFLKSTGSFMRVGSVNPRDVEPPLGGKVDKMGLGALICRRFSISL